MIAGLPLGFAEPLVLIGLLTLPALLWLLRLVPPRPRRIDFPPTRLLMDIAPRELVAVALIGIVPCVVVVATATPVRTAAELIAYARANRGKLSFSSSGIGNPQQLAGELMNSMAGTDVLHVPYRGDVIAKIT